MFKFDNCTCRTRRT